VDAGWFFDEELVKLRWEWVSAVDPRAATAGSKTQPSADRRRAEERRHVAARAYFERARMLQAV